jgi:hypothetical protein
MVVSDLSIQKEGNAVGVLLEDSVELRSLLDCCKRHRKVTCQKLMGVQFRSCKIYLASSIVIDFEGR